jgi:hypothetical protein
VIRDPYCYKPWCGLDGKFCIDCVYYDTNCGVRRSARVELIEETCPSCGEIPNNDVTSGCEDPQGCGKVKDESTNIR